MRFRQDGFLIVRGLIAPHEVRELIDHVDELLAGEGELLRVHMLHRKLEIHERYLLHPRILDVVAGLVGPDVLALQTMLFVKGPGSPGQGYHQDSFHIITEPTRSSAWVRSTRDEETAAWVTSGSRRVPGRRRERGTAATSISRTSRRSAARTILTSRRTTSRGSRRSTPGRERPAVLDPGDAVFFGGHVLHRSHANRSATRIAPRLRRALLQRALARALGDRAWAASARAGQHPPAARAAAVPSRARPLAAGPGAGSPATTRTWSPSRSSSGRGRRACAPACRAYRRRSG